MNSPRQLTRLNAIKMATRQTIERQIENNNSNNNDDDYDDDDDDGRKKGRKEKKFIRTACVKRRNRRFLLWVFFCVRVSLWPVEKKRQHK